MARKPDIALIDRICEGLGLKARVEGVVGEEPDFGPPQTVAVR